MFLLLLYNFRIFWIRKAKESLFAIFNYA